MKAKTNEHYKEVEVMDIFPSYNTVEVITFDIVIYHRHCVTGNKTAHLVHKTFLSLSHNLNSSYCKDTLTILQYHQMIE